MSTRSRWVRVGTREMPAVPSPEVGRSTGAVDWAADLAALVDPPAAVATDRAQAPTPADVLEPMRGLDSERRDLEAEILERWRVEHRRIRVVMAGGDPFEARVLGAGDDVVYVADEHGLGRLLYRWAIRELVSLDEV